MAPFVINIETLHLHTLGDRIPCKSQSPIPNFLSNSSDLLCFAPATLSQKNHFRPPSPAHFMPKRPSITKLPPNDRLDRPSSSLPFPLPPKVRILRNNKTLNDLITYNGLSHGAIDHPQFVPQLFNFLSDVLGQPPSTAPHWYFTLWRRCSAAHPVKTC